MIQRFNAIMIQLKEHGKKINKYSFICLLSFSSLYSQSYDGVEIEKGLFKKVDSNNKIYKIKNTLNYEYVFIKNNEKHKMYLDEITSNYELINVNNISKDNKCILSTVTLEVVKPNFFGRTNKNQTEIKYSYNFCDLVTLDSHTGLIENNKNIWYHPPRLGKFKILQFSPFPYIKFPLQENKQWIDSLKVSSLRLKELNNDFIKKNIIIKYTYKIIGKEQLIINDKSLTCWVVDSNAFSEIGNSELKMYFHEVYGFVKLIYKNLDGSSIIFVINNLSI